MKTKVFFFLMLLCPAIAALSQTKTDGLRITYYGNHHPISRTFFLDSIKNWGYAVDQGWPYVFVNTNQGENIRSSSIRLGVFEYPPIHITPLRDYLIVRRTEGQAAFCLDEGFEMTWKENLKIKDSFQSQLVGLDEIVALVVVKSTYGYVNPSIRGKPVNYSRYLQVYTGESRMMPMYSFSDSYVCTADENDLIFSGKSVVIRVAKNDVEWMFVDDTARGNVYR